MGLEKDRVSLVSVLLGVALVGPQLMNAVASPQSQPQQFQFQQYPYLSFSNWMPLGGGGGGGGGGVGSGYVNVNGGGTHQMVFNPYNQLMQMQQQQHQQHQHQHSMQMQQRPMTLQMQMQMPVQNNANNNHNEPAPECQTSEIPCSGHTTASCQQYCHSVGIPMGTCQGSCCLCTNMGHQFNANTNSNSNSNSNSDSRLTDSANQFGGSGLGLADILNHNHNHNQLMQMKTKQQNQNQKNEIDYDNDLEFSESRTYPRTFQKNANEYENKIFLDKNKNKVGNNGNKVSKAPWTSFGKYSGKSPEIDRHDANANTNTNTNTNVQSPKGVCQTESCKNAGKQLKSNMNPSADPCTNFYEYACGGFISRSRIPHDETEVTAFSTLRNKVTKQLNVLLEQPQGTEPRPFRLAKTFYKSCMGTELLEQNGIEPMKSVLETLGGWPVVLGNRWQPQYLSWSNFLVWFRELGFNHNVFMKISVEPDIKNVNRRVITTGEPELGLSREVLIKGMADSSVQAYYKYMVNSAILFGASRPQAESEMLQALSFEIELAKSFHRIHGSRASSYYMPTAIRDLEAQNPTVPWLALLQRLFPDTVSLNHADIVIIQAPHYLQAFLPLVESTDIRTVSNYAIWRMVSSTMSYMNESARKLQFQFAAAVTGQKQRVPRWKECTELVSTSMGNAVGAMYIRKYFDHSSKAEAQEMIDNVHRGFLTILDSLDWMDAATKRKAKEKANAINIFVGYPQEHLKDGPITELYSEYDFQEKDYLGNIRNLVIAATNLSFRKLKVPISRNDWISHGKNAMVNAFYHPLDNSIQLPAGILQSPFFDRERPRYLNYGAIGWITGHEITHGFDDQGHQFDKFGNHANWWDPFTKRTYTSKTQCIVKQYGDFRLKGSNLKVNGVTNQGENIADNGGIKQAYLGYLSWVRRHGEEKTLPGFESSTPEQLFWISAANNWCSVYRSERLKTQIISGVHSPGEFRVRGTFANNLDFARDFNCPANSPMNPPRKCDIW